MRSLFVSAALVALLVACSPAPQREAEAPSDPAPQVQACNDVAPDLARMVRHRGANRPLRRRRSDLRGGAITPGTYDLTRAVRIGQATGWQGERAVALEVTEDPGGGVMFNWAGAAAGGDVDRVDRELHRCAGEHPISPTRAAASAMWRRSSPHNKTR